MRAQAQAPAQAGTANLRDVYARKALSQIPRLLSLQDRNEFSRTYGCFNREYWLCRTLDFPSSIAQFGTHSLALVHSVPFPDNPYYQNPKVLQWTLAGIDYWMKIQKGDGSFDEFYPNERGWAGPTGFLLYAMCASYRLVGDAMPPEMRTRFLDAVARAGHYLARQDEPGVLANHHAMALLPIYEAYDLIKDPKLKSGFDVRVEDFLRYCYDEGWCLEYDGTDLGYLSATVSFLAKLQKLYQDPRLDQVCRRAIEFSSYFVYPNGHYAGSMGSRNTLHFYPHGYEVYGGQGVPLASAVAERMLRGLDERALVPPEIQEDRYFLYRIPEFLESWVDYSARPESLPALPYEREPFSRYWPGAKIHARRGRDARGRDYYALTNLAKGGVFKLFRLDTGELVESDCGVLASLANGKVVSSQWIDEAFRTRHEPPPAAAAPSEAGPGEEMVEVAGPMHHMVMKLFNPITMIAFRVFMLAFGWHDRLAYAIKGWIRNLLMTRSAKAPASFRRSVSFGPTSVTIHDEIIRQGVAFTKVRLGDEFFVRYVPQSRYFQLQELPLRASYLTSAQIKELNRAGRITIARQVDYHLGAGAPESGA